jgi:hypothetical protein
MARELSSPGHDAEATATELCENRLRDDFVGHLDSFTMTV